MILGIIGAMEQEVANLKNKLENLEIKKINHLEFYIGKINNTEIVLTVSGVGKVSSGIIIAVMVSNFKIDKFINIGISGGNSDYLDRGDVAIGNYFSYADADATLFSNYEYGQIPGMPRIFEGDKEMLDLVDAKYKRGMILSGDKFFTSKEECDKVAKSFDGYKVLAFDMESCALAQACYIFNVPFISIRVISDLIGVENQLDKYCDYCQIAADKANEIMYNIINNI